MWIRLPVAVVVITPLMLAFGGSWVTTLGIAIVGFGLGRAAEAYTHVADGEQRSQRIVRITTLSALWLLGWGAVAGARLWQAEQAVAELRDTTLLPTERPVEAASGPAAVVTVHPDGLELDGARVTPEEVHAMLAELQRAQPDATVELHVSSDDVPYADVVMILEMVVKAGLEPSLIP